MIQQLYDYVLELTCCICEELKPLVIRFYNCHGCKTTKRANQYGCKSCVQGLNGKVKKESKAKQSACCTCTRTGTIYVDNISNEMLILLLKIYFNKQFLYNKIESDGIYRRIVEKFVRELAINKVVMYFRCLLVPREDDQSYLGNVNNITEILIEAFSVGVGIFPQPTDVMCSTGDFPNIVLRLILAKKKINALIRAIFKKLPNLYQALLHGAEELSKDVSLLMSDLLYLFTRSREANYSLHNKNHHQTKIEWAELSMLLSQCVVATTYRFQILDPALPRPDYSQINIGGLLHFRLAYEELMIRPQTDS